MMAALYAFGAHGIMTLNDFKALEGDRQHGVRSLARGAGAGSGGQDRLHGDGHGAAAGDLRCW